MSDIVEQYRTELTVRTDNTYEHNFEGTANGTTTTATITGTIDVIDTTTDTSLQNARAHFAQLAAVAKESLAAEASAE